MSDWEAFPLTAVDRGDMPFPSFSVFWVLYIVLQFTFMLNVFYVNQNKSFFM